MKFLIVLLNWTKVISLDAIKADAHNSVTSKVVVLYILKQQVSLTLIRHSSSLQSCGVGMRFRTDLHQSHKIASTPS